MESFSQLPDLLANAGIHVDVVGTARVRHMRHCAAVGKFTEIGDGAEGFSRELSAEVGGQQYDSIILVDEPALNGVLDALHNNESVPSSCLPFDLDAPLAAVLGSKARFYEFCQQHDIRLPATHMATSRDEAEEIALRIGFPCVLKGTTGSGGQSVYMINNREELSHQLTHWNYGLPIIVQQYIAGVAAAATFFSFKGELRAWMATANVLSLNDGKGPKVAARFLCDPAIQAACEKFARLGNYTGITGFDFMLSDSGEVYIIDPHFGRLTALSHMGLYCGVDFGVCLRDALQGKATVHHPQPTDITAVKFPECVNYALTGGFWKLMRVASPFSSRTRYCINPRLGLRFNLTLAGKSVLKSLRWRQNVAIGAIRKPLSRVKQAMLKTAAMLRQQTKVA